MSYKKNRHARPEEPRAGCGWEAIGEEPKRRHQHYTPPPFAGHVEDLFTPRSSATNTSVAAEQLGPTYSGDLDGARLTSQLDAVLALMQDGTWRTLSQIKEAIGRGSEAGISARLRELRHRHAGGYIIERKRVGGLKSGLWAYRVMV